MTASLSEVLMEQHHRRSLTNSLSALHKKGAQRGIKHHNAKYTEEQIKDAKAIHIAFQQLNLKANYVAIAGLTEINILSVKGLFRKIRPTWTHLHPEQWRIDKFKQETRLFAVAKAKLAKEKREVWRNQYVPKAVTLKISPNRSTSNQAVNDFFVDVCQLAGREPQSWKEFTTLCDTLIKAGRLDGDYYRRNRHGLLSHRLELYPLKSTNPLKEKTT